MWQFLKLHLTKGNTSENVLELIFTLLSLRNKNRILNAIQKHLFIAKNVT